MDEAEQFGKIVLTIPNRYSDVAFPVIFHHADRFAFWSPTASSFTRATGTNPRTSIWNVTPRKRSSGSNRFPCSRVPDLPVPNSTRFTVYLSSTNHYFWNTGMTTLILDSSALKATAVNVTEDSLVVELADGRTIAAPLGWYPRLFHAAADERGRFRFIAGGEGIHWPDLDEDISVEGIVAGRPSCESPRSLQKWLESRTLPTPDGPPAL